MKCPKCHEQMTKITLKTFKGKEHIYNVCPTCEIKIKE